MLNFLCGEARQLFTRRELYAIRHAYFLFFFLEPWLFVELSLCVPLLFFIIFFRSDSLFLSSSVGVILLQKAFVKLAFPSFLFFADKRLLNHTIKTVEVQNLDDCELLCYQEHNCVSINFENRASGKGKYCCELNNSTHGEHDGDLVEAKNYFYRGSEVRVKR